jgi:hypothetical protein
MEEVWKYYPDEVPELEQKIIVRSYKEEPPPPEDPEDPPFEPDDTEVIYRPGVYHGVDFIHDDNSPSYFKSGYWSPRSFVGPP